MKKKLVLLFTVPLFLMACQKKSENTTPDVQPEQTETQKLQIKIVDNGISKAFGATSFELTVTTDASASPITWTSSDESVAIVNNGVVTFLDVVEKKEVTIKAALNEESFDEVTYEVNPNPIDIDNSDGYIASSFYNGFTITGNQKVLFRKAASTNFFYKASFKSVLRTGSGWFGFYLYNTSNAVNDAIAKVKVEGLPTFKVNGYPYLYLEQGLEETRVALPYNAAFKEDAFSDLGIAKVDSDLYIYGSAGETYQCVEHFFDAFSKDDEFKVGIFTENFDVTLKNFDTSDDARLFDEPTKLILAEESKNLHVEDKYRIQVRGDRLNINPQKITYISSDTDVVTVDEKGVVEAIADGDTVITVKYDNKLETSMNVHVDPKIIVMAINLNKDNAPETFGNEVLINDTLGNPVKWNYVGASASDQNHMALEAGGYIQNVDKLDNITNFKVKGEGSFKLHTGYEGYEHVQTLTLDGEESINLSCTRYFKLEALTASTVESIYGEYDDQETTIPTWTKGSGEGPVYDTANWNRLIHDISSSNDFTYTLTFTQESSSSDRTKRPTFFIYPACYQADDRVACTDDNNHYFNGSGEGNGGYYHIRQDNYQVCHASGTDKSEIKICTESAWVNNTITGKSTSQENKQFGGSKENAGKITQHSTMTVTIKLENKYKEDSTRYQVWTVTMSCVTTTDGFTENPYVENYVLKSNSGNIFPSDSIGISVALNSSWNGTFTMLSATSTGVR